jgi:hypothetical protein
MSTQPHETEEYKAGQAAARHGLPVISCPHTLDTPQGELWVQGWEQTTDNMQRVAHGLAASALAAGGIMEHPKPNTGASVPMSHWDKLHREMYGSDVGLKPCDVCGCTSENSQREQEKKPGVIILAYCTGCNGHGGVRPGIMAAGSDNPPRKAGTTPLHLEAGKIVQKHITHATATPDYCRGFEARKDGKNLWDNPHATTSQAHAEWKRGWETAHHLGSARRDATPESTVLPVDEFAKLGTWDKIPMVVPPTCPKCQGVDMKLVDFVQQHAPNVEKWQCPKCGHSFAADAPITIEQARAAWNTPPIGTDGTKALENLATVIAAAKGRVLRAAEGKPEAVIVEFPSPRLETPAGFIAAMEVELAANADQKGRWSDWLPEPKHLISEIEHHVAKLTGALAELDHHVDYCKRHPNGGLIQERQQDAILLLVAEHSADVGNFAAKAWLVHGRRTAQNYGAPA